MNPLGTNVGPRNAAVMALALCAALVCLVPASLIGQDTFPQPATAYNLAKMQKERMGRGVYAVRISESEVLMSAEPTKWRFHTFMEDPVYRISVLTQNNGYNMPTTTGFYFGPDLLGHGITFRGTKLP